MKCATTREKQHQKYVGEKLLAARVAAGLNQEELARLIDVWYVTISKWERGASAINASYLHKICKALNVSSDVVIGLKD